MRYLLLGALLGAVVCSQNCPAEDITLPLEGGKLVISEASFIRLNDQGAYIPELSFTLHNHTPIAWKIVDLTFIVDGTCSGVQREWLVPVRISVGWSKEKPASEEYSKTVTSLFGKVNECATQTIKASLVLAESERLRIDGIAGKRIDFEEEARKAAATAAEQKRKQAQADARAASAAAERNRRQAAADAKTADERKAAQEACVALYKRTADKKIGDLTVKEDQQVKACQTLGLYRPR